MALTDTEKINLLFKKVFAGKSNSSNSLRFFNETENGRLHVDSTDVWSEAHLIPNSGIGEITGSVTPGQVTQSGVVAYYSASGFGGISGLSTAYTSSVQDWIPFNFGDGVTYTFVLTKNDGSQINASDPSDWIFDVETGTLLFNSGNPDDVSHSSPPSMSAYAYVGKKLNTGLNTQAITASGNISASGDITGSSYTGSFVGDGLCVQTCV